MTPMIRRAFLVWLMVATCIGTTTQARTVAKTLDIYVIDVEGGQATLIVTPSGESLLIDAGFPSDGTFASKPGLAARARDAQRIVAAAKDAGVTEIDYLMLTHYHADHAGGVPELAQLLRIKTFIDHAAPTAEAEKGVAGTQGVYDAYSAVRANGKHIQPKAGDRLPLNMLGGGVEVVVVASEDKVMSRPIPGDTPMPGVSRSPSICEGTGIAAQEKTENPRSTAVRLRYGRFSFLDVGDLSGPSLFALTCPTNLIGDTDVYLVSHHGADDAADPSLYRTIKPLVAITNNAEKKGAQKETMALLKQMQSSIDTWQLHRTLAEGSADVAPSDRIANLDNITSAWIKISANADGTFSVMNGRTGFTKSYAR